MVWGLLVIIAFLLSKPTISASLKNSNKKKKIKDGQPSHAESISDSTVDNTPLLHLLEDFVNDPKLFGQFKLVQSKPFIIYHYLKDGYFFEVHYDYSSLSFSVKRNNVEVMNLFYQYNFNTFRIKRISRSVIENSEREKAMSIIGTFNTIAINKKLWHRNKDAITIIDDLKSIKPVYTKTNNSKSSESCKQEATEQASIDKTSSSLSHLHSLVRDNGSKIPDAILVQYQTILPKMDKCLTHLHRLDLEKRHSFEKTLQEDLNKLLTSYQELSHNSQKEIEEKVSHVLTLVDMSLFLTLSSLEAETKQEVEKQVRVMKTRSYSKY